MYPVSRRRLTSGFLKTLLLIVSLGYATTLSAEILRADPDTYMPVLRKATGGDTVLLAPGTYPTLWIDKNTFLAGSPEQPIILASADPSNPARLLRLRLKEVSNITFDGLIFDYLHADGAAIDTKEFTIADAQNITIRNSVFDGVEQNFGRGFGLMVRWTKGFRLENSQIRGFYRGAVVTESRDIVVADNEFYGMSSDGLNFSEVRNVRIEGNQLRDFRRSKSSQAHPDMIQFWTNGNEIKTRDVVIRRNLLEAGTGMWTQSIFMRNEKVDSQNGGRDFFYRNITIEDNVIVNGHLHGITVGETDGLMIRNNTVVRNAASAPGARYGVSTPQIRVARRSQNVTVTQNVAAVIEGHEGQSGWRVANNFIVQDQGRAQSGFYGAVFGPAALESPPSVQAFAPRSGGPLDGAGIGATWLSSKN